MSIFSFYNSPKPRNFHYNYMYHNPRKEALDEKIRLAKQELKGEQNMSSDDIKTNIKGSFHHASNHLKGQHSSIGDRQSRMTQTWYLLLILALLIAIVWYFYFK